MSDWNLIVEAESRLQRLCAAAAATIRGNPGLTNHDVYDMTKPYIAHLVGWRRGLAVATRHSAPEGSALAGYAKAATPFDGGNVGALAESPAYETAVRHVGSELSAAFDAVQRRVA